MARVRVSRKRSAWAIGLTALLSGVLSLGVMSPAAAIPADPDGRAVQEKVTQPKASESAKAADSTKARSPEAAPSATAEDPPDLTKFQKVVLGQGTELGEAMELTVADDGRVFFITRAGDISMYNPVDGSIKIIMNNPELGVWSGLEDGLLGITLDPNFSENNWIYVYYAPLPESYNHNRLSRLTVEQSEQGDTFIDKTSEKILLEVGTQRNICCHSAGSLQFDSVGDLYLATGDNTSSSDNDGYSPHDEREGRSDYDAQKSSANTNDLRGKILRITPRNDDDGDVDPTPGDGVSYDIPAGNLFGEGGQFPDAKYPDADAAKTRPEPYVMGLRNPYRLGLDADTDALYWGEVGPDSRVNNVNRGPRHQEEFNRTTTAMNGGWPYCGGEVGDDLTNMDFGGAYVDWDFVANKYKTNADGSPKRFPCNDPNGMAGVNDSPNSTGLTDLPPMTDAWIPYSDVAPYKYPEVQGGTPIGGQVYRQSQNTTAKDTAFPAYYEGSYFMAEMSRGWIKEVRMNEAGEIQSINDFMSGFVAPGDLEFGPDGSLYVIEYGNGWFSGSEQTKLVRIDYAINGRAPQVKITADPVETTAAPLEVTFSSEGTADPDGDDITYAWDFDNDAQVDSTEANPTFTYTEIGDFNAVLTVTDSTGKSATAQVPVTVGNTRPKVDLQLPVDGGFFDSGDDIDYLAVVEDAEENVECQNVTIQEGLGHDSHVHPNLGVKGCEGTMRTAESTDHGPDANTYGVLSAIYSDQGANGGLNGALTGQDSVTLQPKHRQAEHATQRQGVGYSGYDDKSGTRPSGGGLITGMGNGDWVMFDPMSLVNMTSVSLTYSGSPGANAAVELRAGAPDGPVAARITLNGGTNGLYFYKTVQGEITSRDADPGGEPLYFVYSGTGEMNFDDMTFTGSGVASNVAPTINSITATPSEGPAPLDVAFSADVVDADGDTFTYAWDFGVEGTDADVSTQATPSFTYTEPGTYTATLTATDSTGKPRTGTVEVQVRRPCSTAPTAEDGYRLLFDGTDTSAWKQAGPGGFSAENCELTSHGGLGLYWYSAEQFKDYSLKLQFKLSDGGDNSGVFTRFPDPGTDPWVAVDHGHEIQIKEGEPNDEPQKTGSVYNFDREDARNANPIGEWNDYEIQVVGQTYTMTLNGVVVNEYTSDGSRPDEGFIGLQNHGDADTVAFRNIQIKELDVPEPFINTVSATPLQGGAPLEVTYSAEGVDRQGDALTYEWVFGDGEVASGAPGEITHTYTEGGTYQATVTPVDAAGNYGEPRTLPEITVLVNPVPQATAAPRCGIAPLAVNFVGAATDPQNQDVTYAWDFGVEGTEVDTSTEQSPTYTYAEAGKYNVTLVVTDPDGNTGTQVLKIEAIATGECRAVADLTSFFNNDGISTHNNPGDGNFDGGGWAYAADAMPEAIRDAGGPIVIDGADYDFPNPADGLMNNVEAAGQTIPLPTGSFDELQILGSAHNGDVKSEATLTYADGSTQVVPLNFTDWAVSPRNGETIAIDMAHRHNGSGDTTPRVYLFTQRIGVDSTKDIEKITLPTADRLHIFAISAGKASEPPPCEARRSDEFNDSSLTNNCNWRVRRGDSSLYSVGEGALKLTTGPGEYNSAPNIITQAMPEGEWTVTSKLTVDPTKAGQQAGLVLAGTGNSGFMKLQFVRKSDAGNEWIEFLKSSDANNTFDFSGNWNTGGGSFDGPFLPADFPTTFWLRMSSDGTQVTGSYSVDGQTYTQVGDARALAGIDGPSAGLMAIRGGGADAVVANYDFFRFAGESEPTDVPPVVTIGEPTVTSCSRSDDFAAGTLGLDRWNAIARPDDSLYALQDGDLVLQTSGSELQEDANNLVMQKMPGGGYTAVTKLTFPTSAEGQQAGLLIADVAGNDYLKLALVNKGNGNRWVEFLRIEDGTYNFSGNWHSGPGGGMDGPFLPADFPETVYLRLSSTDGEMFTGEFSADGENWESAGDNRAGFGSAQTVGVYGLHSGDAQATARFGWFGAAPERECAGNQSPTAEILADATSGAAPLTVNFQAKAEDPDGDNLSYAWNFGDGETSEQADPAHVFTEPGVYEVTLTVTDSAGATASAKVEITVTGEQTAKTWVVDAVDTATDNKWVSEDTGTSTVTIKVGDTVRWEFDQATMGHDLTSQDTADAWDPALQEYRNPNGEPVDYTFTKPGTYEYICTIHGATMKGTVVVEEAGGGENQAPTATPLVDPRSGVAPLTVHFEARATDPDGDVLSYEWNFGTGNPADVSVEEHAHFAYTDPGTYTATLKVDDGNGGVLERSFEITVTGDAPTIDVSANPTAGIAPLTVNFGAVVSDPQDETPPTVTWNFGDPDSADNTATGARAAHTYTKPGSYLATATATDADGNTTTDTVSIEVAGESSLEVTATPSSGTAPLEVTFNAEASPNQEVTAGEFHPFADGSATYPDLVGTATMVRSVGQTVTTISVTGLKHHGAHMVHVHEQSCADANGGAHFRFDETQPFSEENEIWLPFTSDMDGASGEVTVTKPKRAGAKAVAIVIHDPDNPALRIGCVDLAPVELHYDWDFGDGQTGTGKSPSHTYTEAGTYTATVVVTDGHGLEMTGTVEVVVEKAEEPGDTTPPETTIIDGPVAQTKSKKAAFRFVSSEPEGATFRCSLDGGAYQTCPANYALKGVKAGSHVLRVVAIDAAGNQDPTPAIWRWTVTKGKPKAGESTVLDPA